MERYKSVNGLNMLRCSPLNWKIERAHRDGTGPEIFCISVGSIGEMFICVCTPEENKLSISNMSYSSDCSLQFKVGSFEEASKMVLSFAQGMGLDQNLKGTIYWNSN